MAFTSVTDQLMRFAVKSGLLAIIAAALFITFSVQILIGLVVILVAAKLLEPIAVRRGWGHEGRLIRHLTRPRFEDSSRKRQVG